MIPPFRRTRSEAIKLLVRPGLHPSVARLPGPRPARGHVTISACRICIVKRRSPDVTRRCSSNIPWVLILASRQSVPSLRGQILDSGSRPIRTSIFSLASRTSCAEARPENRALRARQSRLLAWSARTSPETGPDRGSNTSYGQPFTADVIGQQSAKLLTSL